MRSAVAGSERLKRRVYEATGLQEVFNDNNKHIALKSSPDKTAPALSALAEKEGIVVKLNDTGEGKSTATQELFITAVAAAAAAAAGGGGGGGDGVFSYGLPLLLEIIIR